MSIDLSKNNELLQKAWKDVLSDKTDTNWALFSYEGQTNVLKVISTGANGIDEMKEDLNSGKIMYAFIKVSDPITSLDKCVLINWQGEGANTVRKGMCANHLRDIERFFTGAHLTLNARNEEEVELDLVIEKLKKIGSEYRFKAKPAPVEPATPVGTTYKRINAVKEINSQERDKFWRKEEEEEKNRLDLEKKRKQEESYKLEMEIAQREESETKRREEKTQSRDIAIDEIKKAENNETNDVKPSKHGKIPEKPVRNSILKANAEMGKDIDRPEANFSDDDSDQFSTIKRSPKDNLTKNSTVNEVVAPKEDVKNVSAQENYKEETTLQMTEQQFVDEYIYGISYKARALYDYQAADDTEISFDPGDIITNIEQVDEGWWQGLAPDGITFGLFPANYVELIE